MSDLIRLLIAQTNPNVGSIKDNAQCIIKIIKENAQQYDVIIFPELALTGYLLEDLLFRDELFTQVEIALEEIASVSTSCHIILGHPIKLANKIYNAASIFFNGACIKQYNKQKLPNYGIFDEKRYYNDDTLAPCVFTVKNYQLQLCICEDLWQSEPKQLIANDNIQILIAINASPFDVTKFNKRVELCKKYASLGPSVIYVNQVGGQDELVFDGRSFAIDNTASIKSLAPAFQEHLQEITINQHEIVSEITPDIPEVALTYQALVCGLRDYINKNNFQGILLGLSGGIDSALSLAIAVDAVGPSKVLAVLMPSKYTAQISNEDALEEIKRLGVGHYTLPIDNIFNTILKELEVAFQNTEEDKTEENLQARIRAVLLMAISNKRGYMLLSTSNKSESAVGYTTLYGDMAGGFAVLKDVLKTTVYKLASYRNTISTVIPTRVIERAPSAELAPNQKDEDSLPRYEILDAIIEHYMNDNLDAEKIIQLGYPKDIVTKVIKLIFQSEHKRHQAPPGVKITTTAFGKDWRRPITQGLF